MTWLMRWASREATHVHSDVPTVAELLALGWRIVRVSEMYPNSVLMEYVEPQPTTVVG